MKDNNREDKEDKNDQIAEWEKAFADIRKDYRKSSPAEKRWSFGFIGVLVFSVFWFFLCISIWRDKGLIISLCSTAGLLVLYFLSAGIYVSVCRWIEKGYDYNTMYRGTIRSCVLQGRLEKGYWHTYRIEIMSEGQKKIAYSDDSFAVGELIGYFPNKRSKKRVCVDKLQIRLHALMHRITKQQEDLVTDAEQELKMMLEDSKGYKKFLEETGDSDKSELAEIESRIHEGSELLEKVQIAHANVKEYNDFMNGECAPSSYAMQNAKIKAFEESWQVFEESWNDMCKTMSDRNICDEPLPEDEALQESFLVADEEPHAEQPTDEAKENKPPRARSKKPRKIV